MTYEFKFVVIINKEPLVQYEIITIFSISTYPVQGWWGLRSNNLVYFTVVIRIVIIQNPEAEENFATDLLTTATVQYP